MFSYFFVYNEFSKYNIVSKVRNSLKLCAWLFVIITNGNNIKMFLSNIIVFFEMTQLFKRVTFYIK